jgi:uncharacterized membrane protein HdeD (DUF308 family)
LEEAMTTQTATTEQRPAGKPILMGALMIVLGILCMVLPKAAGAASATWLGWLLVVSGLAELLAGARDRGEQHRGLLLGGGSLWLAVGFLLVIRPAAASGVVSFAFAMLLLAAGIQAVVVPLLNHYRGWSWDLVFGVAAVLLGIGMLLSWPVVALWSPSTLVGIAIVVRGATMLGGGFEPKGRHRELRTA